MQIDERAVENVTILDLKGKLNFGDLSYMDGPGIGEIVAGYTTVSRAGGSLKLLNLTKRIPDLLAITKLLTVFETYQGEQEAVRSFSSPTV